MPRRVLRRSQKSEVRNQKTEEKRREEIEQKRAKEAKKKIIDTGSHWSARGGPIRKNYDQEQKEESLDVAKSENR